MKTLPPSAARRQRAGFSLLELLVTAAVILTLGAITLSVTRGLTASARQANALSHMRQFGALAVGYSTENNGLLPDEGGEGVQSFANLGRQLNAKAWYNVIPAMADLPTGADYRSQPARFYQPESWFHLPGATYPKNPGNLAYFAFAINSQLERGDSTRIRMHEIPLPSRTALFAEARLPDEKHLPPTGNGTAGSDLGQPKVRDRRFVARYKNTGTILFADGHARLVDAREVFDTRKVVWRP